MLVLVTPFAAAQTSGANLSHPFILGRAAYISP
jgi:hypothetical protein